MMLWLVCVAGLAGCAHRPPAQAAPAAGEVVAPSAAPIFGLLRVTRTTGRPIEGVLVSRDGERLMLNSAGRIVLVDESEIARIELLARDATPEPVVRPKLSIDAGYPPLFLGCFGVRP
jgi:hypothetical protein